MSLIKSASPHITDKELTERIECFTILALIPAVVASLYFFGLKAFFIIIVGVIIAALTDILIDKLKKKKFKIPFGAMVTGLLLALTLPPTIPLFVPIVGSFVAISIVKHVFGTRSHIFNPALAGRAFLVAAWPVLMSKWITPDGVTGATPLGALKIAGEKIASYSQLFFGNISGTIGETSALALLIGAAFLFFMKVIDWKIPLAYVGTVFILTFAFGKDPLFHILAGGLMLGAFFMATDYVTTPITKKGRLIFGVGCGLLTVVIRLFSGLPEGVMYSILLMNAFTPLIERYTRPKPFGYLKFKKVEK